LICNLQSRALSLVIIPTFERLKGDMDINAGAILDGSITP
jgi:hypothetical protein